MRQWDQIIKHFQIFLSSKLSINIEFGKISLFISKKQEVLQFERGCLNSNKYGRLSVR